MIIVCAPSGSGKTTILKSLLQARPDLHFSVSHTTRPPRSKEQEGVDYYFVTPSVFEDMIAQNDFLEYVHNYDHYYGTSRRPLEKALRQGQTVILDLETEGVARVKDLYPTSLSIFILPPSLQALKDRLYGRGDESPVQLKLRMAQVAQQFGQASQFDFILLNDDQAHAQAQLSELIKALEAHDKDRVDEMSRATQAYRPLLKTLHDEALAPHEGTKDS
jgi:guanylate kinase